MKKEKKKPDQVVYNEKTQKYDAALKPYATGVGAPAIQVTDTTAWKKRHVQEVNHLVSTQYDELRTAYQALMERFEYNQLIYQSRFRFEPIVGQTYHLYRDEKQELFLSIIEPAANKFDFVGSFKLGADKMWGKLD